jgi:hypothetical protein
LRRNFLSSHRSRGGRGNAHAWLLRLLPKPVS